MTEAMDQEIVKLTENLLDSLNLQLPTDPKEDISFLKSDLFYIEIFKVIMEQSHQPFNEAEFDRETRSMTAGERIQTLIHILSRDIVQVDLEHIKGEKIANGDKKHIANMLQLLDALSQNLKQELHGGEEDGEEEQKIESDLNRHESFSQEKELNRGIYEKKENRDSEGKTKGHSEMFTKMMADGKLASGSGGTGQGNIPIYSDDPINYNQIELQPKYTKPKKVKKGTTRKGDRPKTSHAQVSQQGRTRPKSGLLKNKKAAVVRIIEDNVYGDRRYRNIKNATLVKDPLNTVTPGVVQEFNRIKKEGDGIEYDPMPLEDKITSLRQYLDDKKKDDDVKLAVSRQKQQYRKELEDFIGFNKKVVYGFKLRIRT